MIQIDAVLAFQHDAEVGEGSLWDERDQCLYWVDIHGNALHRYEYDRETGQITNKRVVTGFDKDSEGLPDGMAIDMEDGLWVAMFGGSAVLRIDPASGERTHKVKLPTSNITSCAFGGDDLSDLYITSATVHMNEEQLRAQPTAGSLFVARSPIPGQTSHRYRSSTLNPCPSKPPRPPSI